MTGLRDILRRSPRLALGLIAVALLARLLVPAGFMPVAGAGQLTVAICSGAGTVTVAVPGLPDQHEDEERPAPACGFAGLSMPTLGGADPLLLAVAIAFVLALGWRATVVAAPAEPTRLRPPLRGPPLPA